MAMKAKLWTLNGLAVELGRDVRTLGKALSGVQPDGMVGKNPGYHIETALSALRRRGAARSGQPGDRAEAEAIFIELEELAVAIDDGFKRLRAEPDIKKRRQRRSARSYRQDSRFSHPINTDEVFGTHRSMAQETDRGREHHCWCPPAQIRTSPIRASGSYLGCLTAKRSLGQG